MRLQPRRRHPGSTGSGSGCMLRISMPLHPLRTCPCPCPCTTSCFRIPQGGLLQAASIQGILHRDGSGSGGVCKVQYKVSRGSVYEKGLHVGFS